MKLSRLYTNQPRLFAPIEFNGVSNRKLSVIFARITKPRDEFRDNHNLGKTTLIHLLDFLLLKQIDKQHILLKHSDLFSKFDFYLEIQTPAGGYVTIKRGVEHYTRASLKKHEASIPDLTSAGRDEWDHADITIERTRQLLDSYLSLNQIKPWDYRKGVSYFLRTQADYRDYFQIEKFVKGRDLEWKPYLAHIVGIDAELVEKKYRLDDEIEELQRRRLERQAEVNFNEQDYTKLQARIAIEEQEVQTVGKLLDTFDFRKQEERVNRNLVQTVERRISELNDDLYRIEYDLDQLRSALKTGFAFKVEVIKQIFDEAQTYLPEQLYRDYSSLVEFNKKLTKERNTLIRRQIRTLEAQRQELTKEAESRNQERVQLLSLLGTEDTFRKFKGLQKDHSKQQAELQYLLGQKERLEKVLTISRELRDKEREREEAAAALKDSVQSPTERTRRIQIEFNNLTRRVLDLIGEFYIKINQNGNLEFTIDPKLPSSRKEVSSQGEGTSYKKLLCALFDLAILRTYAREPFYHFVYHDGILEGLDVRKRRLVLEVLRQTSSEFGIQCMISAIDTDLPRDENDQKIAFPQDEIILELDDSGPSGRLFRMKEF